MINSAANTFLGGGSSVQGPCAQSKGLFRAEHKPAKMINVLMSEIEDNLKLSLQDKAVSELLILYGLRISEVLNIEISGVLRTGGLLVKGAKGSGDRIVFPVSYRHFWTDCSSRDLPISQLYSRFYYYRLYRKLGYYAKFGTNKNNSVTHYFRHRMVQNLQNEGVSERSISEFVNHRSYKSLESYVKH